MKTENAQHAGRHAFEVAGLGLAPFRFVGASENVITYPDGTQKAGGCCDYCFTGIRAECWVQSADGKRFKVGCNCIAKVGDAGLLKAYKTSPEYRAKQRQLRTEKANAVFAEFQAVLERSAAALRGLPHPSGYTDRQTGAPLTAFDWAQWMFDHCGDSGRRAVLTRIKSMVSQPSIRAESCEAAPKEGV